MIDYELYAKIRHYHEQKGLTPAQIGQELELDPRTVTRWLEEKRYRQRASGGRPSKLDPYKDAIVRMLEDHPYTAAQVLNRIKGQGYDGGYSILKEYVAKVRPKRSKAYLKLSFAPGECAQVDWGSCGTIRVGSATRKLSVFVMVLCYSRVLYAELTVSQTMEHFLACHQNAFEAFGGVPGKVMVDNLKSAVLSHRFGQQPVFNPVYADFARHYGYEIRACGVRKPHEKGRVESAVGYIKGSFLAGLELPDFRGINQELRHWLATVANVRLHGEVKRKPSEMLVEEKPLLLRLPSNPYDIGVVSPVRVSSQFRVAVDANKYSVPSRFAGLKLTLKTYPDRLCFYDDDQLVARHCRSYDKHQDFEDPDHVGELLNQRKAARDQKILTSFLRLDACAQDYLDALRDKRLNVRHHIQKIVALSEIHGIDPVARAMRDAFEFKAFSCEYIANIIEQRARSLPEPGALHLTRGEDLLDLEVKAPDLSIYTPKEKKNGR